MMEQPLDPTMTAEETANFHQILVHSGLRIQDMNALRKHFSAVKGGRLAVAAATATKLTLLVSDVPGDAVHVIGSGPTLPDPTTIADCRTILKEHADALPFPATVMEFFASDSLPETPKDGDEAFLKASSFTLISSKDLCIEASRLAKQEGFHVVVDNSCDEWAYDDDAEYLLERLEQLHALHGKVCLLSAGEISVKVKGSRGGIGGRNQHFALECARRIAHSERPITVLSAGTDGIDGNSDATGAICDENTVTRASALGWSVPAALDHFNSGSLLNALGDTLVTGPSGNNVRDLRILLTM